MMPSWLRVAHHLVKFTGLIEKYEKIAPNHHRDASDWHMNLSIGSSKQISRNYIYERCTWKIISKSLSHDTVDELERGKKRRKTEKQKSENEYAYWNDVCVAVFWPCDGFLLQNFVFNRHARARTPPSS